MNKILNLVKSIRESLVKNGSEYPKYNELTRWIKTNYKTGNFYLTFNEINSLVEKIAFLYDDVVFDRESFLEELRPFLNINELKTLECNYRTETEGRFIINNASCKSKARLWNGNIALSTVINGESILFCISPDGIVRNADVKLYFESIIGEQKSDLSLNRLYLLLRENSKEYNVLNQNSKKDDFPNIFECISLHYDDVALRGKILGAAEERILDNQKSKQKTYS